MIKSKDGKDCRLLIILQNKYEQNREIIVYLICGFLTFVLSMVIYALLSEVLRIDVMISNVITWIIAVYFAFSINRRFVFKSNGNVMKELMQFYLGRVLTLFVEQLMLYVFIVRLMYDNMTIKGIAQVVIIILNYIISKFIVFKKENNDK